MAEDRTHKKRGCLEKLLRDTHRFPEAHIAILKMASAARPLT